MEKNKKGMSICLLIDSFISFVLLCLFCITCTNNNSTDLVEKVIVRDTVLIQPTSPKDTCILMLGEGQGLSLLCKRVSR